MTKEDIKNYLQGTKASKKLIQMPAVMERIYACLAVDEGSLYEGLVGNSYGIKQELYKIYLYATDDGDIELNDGITSRIFKEKSDGRAVYINRDENGYTLDEMGEYTIDQYGMDERFEGKDNFVIERTEKGTIKVGEMELQDNGSAILNSYQLLLEENPHKSFDENRDKLYREYPETDKWFEMKGQDKLAGLKQQTLPGMGFEDEYIMPDQDTPVAPQDEIDEKDARIEQMENEIELLLKENNNLRASSEQIRKTSQDIENENILLKDSNVKLTAENARLSNENSDLRERNTKLHKMLQQALELCDRVKHSFVGKLFFGKDVKRLGMITDGSEQPKQQQER